MSDNFLVGFNRNILAPLVPEDVRENVDPLVVQATGIREQVAPIKVLEVIMVVLHEEPFESIVDILAEFHNLVWIKIAVPCRRALVYIPQVCAQYSVIVDEHFRMWLAGSFPFEYFRPNM